METPIAAQISQTVAHEGKNRELRVHRTKVHKMEALRAVGRETVMDRRISTAGLKTVAVVTFETDEAHRVVKRAGHWRQIEGP